MSLDFKIDDRGDFILSTPPLHKRLKISFVHSTYPVLRIRFEQGQESKAVDNANKLCVRFTTCQGQETMNRKISTVSDKDELRQRIMMRLRTEAGEVRLLPSLGSYVTILKHEDILSEKTHAELRSAVLFAIADIVEDANVVVVPKRKTGPFFCQNINVYIYQKDTLLYSFSL